MSKFRVEELSPEAWGWLSEDLHKVAFDRLKPASFDRIDGAFVVLDREKDQVAGYAQFRYHDHETMYLQFGGAMPGLKGTGQTPEAFDVLIKACFRGQSVKRITFLVENDNVKMIKLALNAGFKIGGIRVYKDKVLLEHGLERS